MKKLWIALVVLLLPMLARAQTAQLYYAFTVTATGGTADTSLAPQVDALNVRISGISTTASWTAQIQTSPDNATWTNCGDAVTATAGSSSSGGACTPSGAAFVRVLITAGAGGGNVVGALIGTCSLCQVASSGGITLTTTGTSGPATLVDGVLNIPEYSGGATFPSGLNGQVLTNVGGGTTYAARTLPFVTPESYGATGTGNTYFDGVITSGTASIASATASFTSGMVGEPICVAKAASGGGQMCGTISSFTDSSHVGTSFTPTASGTALNFAFGADDTTAWQTMLTTAPCNTTGCRINVAPKGYVLTGSLQFPPKSTVVVSGAGPSIPNEENNFPSALVNSNSGSRLMFLTKSLAAGAVQFIGTNCSGCPSTSAPLGDRVENVAFAGGTGTFGDGGGSDGVVIHGWQSLSFVNDQVYGFTGRGYYIDGPGYIEGIKIELNLITYNGLQGIQVGAAASGTGNLETIKVDSTVIEINGAQGIWLDSPAGVIQGFNANNDTIQWNNIAAPGTEILVSAAPASCEIHGNYFEVDNHGGSQSTAYANGLNTSVGCNFHDNNLAAAAIVSPQTWGNGTTILSAEFAANRIQNINGNGIIDSSGNITGTTATINQSGATVALNVNNTDAFSALQIAGFLAPNLTSGATGHLVYEQFGVATSTNNGMNFQFDYVGGTGASTNFGGWAVAGATNINAAIFGNGSTVFGETAPVAGPANGIAVGTTGQFQVTGAGIPILPHFIVSALPAVPAAGGMVVVTDASTFTAGTCTGSGSDTVLAISNGTSWVCQ